MSGQETRESDAGRMDPSMLPPDLVTCRDLGFLILGGGLGEKGVGCRTNGSLCPLILRRVEIFDFLSFYNKLIILSYESKHCNNIGHSVRYATFR